jgi:hypothetical protein
MDGSQSSQEQGQSCLFYVSQADMPGGGQIEGI